MYLIIIINILDKTHAVNCFIEPHFIDFDENDLVWKQGARNRSNHLNQHQTSIRQIALTYTPIDKLINYRIHLRLLNPTLQGCLKYTKLLNF